MNEPNHQPSLPSRRSLRGLDWLNFFLADVQTGIGPFLAIYLTATRHWDAARVGIVISVAGIATIAAQAPAGALIDASRYKRWLVAGGAAAVGLGCLATVYARAMISEVGVQILIGLAAAIFPTAIAAISRGVVGKAQLPCRIARNEGFNHAGNVIFAVLCGLIGTMVSQSWIFYVSALAAIGSVAAVLLIGEQDIDHAAARGDGVKADQTSEQGQPRQTSVPRKCGGRTLIGERPTTWRELARDRRILIFAASVVIFHFANAAMLPLVGELLSRGRPHESSLYMGACIVIAQAVMVPVALVTGRVADHLGRKLPFQIGFAVLALRGFLYTFGRNPYYLISVQALDGVGAAIFGVLWVLIAADLAKGTGRFNTLQGAIQTCLGLGAFLSNFLAGLVVKNYGYNTGFVVLGLIACFGLVVFTLKMPETAASVSAAPHQEPALWGRRKQVGLQRLPLAD
jgi:MFS family permease